MCHQARWEQTKWAWWYRCDPLQIGFEIPWSSPKIIKLAFNHKENFANASRILKLINVYIPLNSMIDQWNSQAADVPMGILELRVHDNVQMHSIFKIDHYVSVIILKFIKWSNLQSIRMSVCEWRVIECNKAFSNRNWLNLMLNLIKQPLIIKLIETLCLKYKKYLRLIPILPRLAIITKSKFLTWTTKLK